MGLLFLFLNEILTEFLELLDNMLAIIFPSRKPKPKITPSLLFGKNTLKR